MSDPAIAEAPPGAGRADPGGRQPVVETYDSRLFDSPIRAIPDAPYQSGQRTWTVQLLSEDRQQVIAEVQARLTGQFGPEQLTNGSYVKDALRDQLADGPSRADGFTSTAETNATVEAFTTETSLGRINARPHPADDPANPSQRVWEITLETDDGEVASVRARFTGQLTEEDIVAPDSYIKGALLRQLAADSTAREKAFNEDLRKSLQPTAIVIAARDEAVEGTLTFDWKSGEFTRITNVEKGAQGGFLNDLQQGPIKRISDSLPESTSVDMIQANTFRPLSGDGAKEVTRRDYGISIAQEFGKFATVSANLRGGDFNLRSLQDGVALTVTVEAKAETLAAIGRGTKTAAGGRLDFAGRALEGAGKAVEESLGGSAGLAFQGKAYYDEQTEQLILKFNDLEIPIKDFFNAFERAVEDFGPVNHGHSEIARANNYQAYVNGENPYVRAVDTRTPDGEWVNHGDPVADLAARGVILGEIAGVDTGEAEYVRYNDQVAAALNQLIERNELTPVAPEYRHLVEEYRTDDKPWLEPLTPSQSEYLEETLAQMHRYGVAGLYGPEVKAAAEEAAAERSDQPPVADDEREFVQSVFEGKFRAIARADERNALENFNQMLANFTGLRASLGLSLGDMAAERLKDLGRSLGLGSAERIDFEQVTLARALESRLNEQQGGILEALGIDPSVAESAEQRRSLETFASLQLADELRAPDAERVDGTAAYEAFLELGPAEREQLGERIVEAWDG